MFNIKNNLKIHNNYHYKLLDKNGKIIQEDTLYNSANNGMYITDIQNTVTSNTIFRIRYQGYHLNDEGEKVLDDKNSYIATNVKFIRMTESNEITFGEPISFNSTVEYAASTNFVGKINQFSLGGERIIYDADHVETDRLHWSECECTPSIEKTESNILIIDITFNISVAAPHLPYTYIDTINSILNVDVNAFPTPAPRWIGLSALNLNGIDSEGTDNKKLKKIVPIFCTLPTISEVSQENGTYKIFNPTTTTEEPNSFFLPAVGSSYAGDYNRNYNYGIANSMVFGGIGATNINITTQEGDNPIIIPVVRLNLQNLINLLEDEEAEEFYFYGSIPQDCLFDGIYLNGDVAQIVPGIEWINPTNFNNITISKVGMSEGEEKDISEYQSTANILVDGTYYANYVFSNSNTNSYWEPPDGSPICPKYIYFSEKPNNVTLGNNISCVIQGYRNNNWETLLTGVRYSTVYLTTETVYDRYRAIITAPSTSELGYFVNSLESTVLPNKTYDPNVIKIGNASNDFGKTGIKISREKIEEWRNSFAPDQQTATNYTVGISIKTNGKFYKAANSLAYIQYGVTTSGV